MIVDQDAAGDQVAFHGVDAVKKLHKAFHIVGRALIVLDLWACYPDPPRYVMDIMVHFSSRRSRLLLFTLVTHIRFLRKLT